MGKVSKKDFLGTLEGFSPEEKAFMEKNAEVVCNIINKAIEGLLRPEDVETQFTAITEKLTLSETERTKVTEKLNEMKEVVKKLSEELEKAKKAGVSIQAISKFNDAFDKMMDSPKMQNFIAGHEKNTGYFPGFSVKDISNITSVADNYEGEQLLTRQSNIFANKFVGPKVALRDVIKVIQADPEHPQFSFLKVKSFDRNAQYETENGRLKQSTLELEEVTVKPRRVGSYFDLSKDLLLARLMLRAWIISMIPGIITQSENAVILFGDGKNNTLNGIALEDGVTSIEEQIIGTIESGKAGSVKSISEHKRGVLVEFVTPISKALDSMMITFTGASVNKGLAEAHPIVKINDHQAIVLGVEYEGEEATATLAAMTFSVNHASFKAVEDPNSRDVIAAILACLSFAQYAPNAIVLNPLTVFLIQTEKDALGRSLDLVQNINGVNYVAGIPIIELNTMPVGDYLAGDFQNGAFLFDYTSLEMAFAEDAETVLYNMVRLWFQEQLGLVTVMPWAFAYGKLEAVKEAIAAETTDASLEIEEEGDKHDQSVLQ